jgi:hypothetical protein
MPGVPYGHPDHSRRTRSFSIVNRSEGIGTAAVIYYAADCHKRTLKNLKKGKRGIDSVLITRFPTCDSDYIEVLINDVPWIVRSPLVKLAPFPDTFPTQPAISMLGFKEALSSGALKAFQHSNGGYKPIDASDWAFSQHCDDVLWSGSKMHDAYEVTVPVRTLERHCLQHTNLQEFSAFRPHKKVEEQIWPLTTDDPSTSIEFMGHKFPPSKPRVESVESTQASVVPARVGRPKLYDGEELIIIAARILHVDDLPPRNPVELRKRALAEYAARHRKAPTEKWAKPRIDALWSAMRPDVGPC